MTSSTFFVPFSCRTMTSPKQDSIPPKETVSEVRSCQRPDPQGARSKHRAAARVSAHGTSAPCVLLSCVMEVWGFEPQTYGLQSHRSSHLSYTPPLVLRPGAVRTNPCKRGPRRLPTPAVQGTTCPGATLGFATNGERREPAIVTGCLE